MIVPCRELMPVVRGALERGQHVRITVTGTSMLPFIRGGDVVELEPVHQPSKVGDIVLLQCPDERYVLHRVVRVEGEGLFLRGDAQSHCEGPFAPGDVLARATLARRGGHARVLDRGAWRFAGLAWARCAPLTPWFLRLTDRMRGMVARRLRRIVLFASPRGRD